jgi:hypothetical protein
MFEVESLCPICRRRSNALSGFSVFYSWTGQVCALLLPGYVFPAQPQSRPKNCLCETYPDTADPRPLAAPCSREEATPAQGLPQYRKSLRHCLVTCAYCHIVLRTEVHVDCMVHSRID